MTYCLATIHNATDKQQMDNTSYHKRDHWCDLLKHPGSLAMY